MPTRRPTKDVGVLTVVAIRRTKGEGVTEYFFNERERIFKLRANMKSSEEFSKRLEEAVVMAIIKISSIRRSKL